MTPEEWANDITELVSKNVWGLRGYIANLVGSAVAEERERCAQIVETSAIWPSRDQRGKIADLIRGS